MSITRWDCEIKWSHSTQSNYIDDFEIEDGRYVRHEDYAADVESLRSEMAEVEWRAGQVLAMNEKLTAEVEALRAKLSAAAACLAQISLTYGKSAGEMRDMAFNAARTAKEQP